MKIIQNLLLGSLAAFSTTVLAEPTYLSCPFEDSGFIFYANEDTGKASLSFFNDGDAFPDGNVFFRPTDVNFNARSKMDTGTNQIVMKVSRVDLTFHFRQNFSPSTQGRSIGLSHFKKEKKGTCSLSKKETNIKRIF